MRKKPIRNRSNKSRMQLALNRNVTNYALFQCLSIMARKMDEMEKNVDYIKRVLESRI